MLYKLVRNCVVAIGYEETDLRFIYYHSPSRLLRSAATIVGAWMKLLGDVEGITEGRRDIRRHCAVKDPNIESKRV